MKKPTLHNVNLTLPIEEARKYAIFSRFFKSDPRKLLYVAFYLKWRMAVYASSYAEAIEIVSEQLLVRPRFRDKIRLALVEQNGKPMHIVDKLGHWVDAEAPWAFLRTNGRETPKMPLFAAVKKPR